jgi:NADPH:quinone reductase-like Zn-dependent oxidoreductase
VLAVTAVSTSLGDPLQGLAITDVPEPQLLEGWTNVRVKAASLNHHDLWTLQGVGIDPDRLPIVLGCDAAGTTDDGREVIVHSVITSPDAEAEYGGEMLDPTISVLSEQYDGTLAEYVAVPARNLVAKPAELSFDEAACLPTAYLTAYRALFVQAGLKAGDSVLVQGAGGGFATACVLLGKAGGLRVFVTSRSEERRERVLALGADAALEPGARLPDRVDAVMESVGEATWEHSVRAVRPGGSVVVVGATAGHQPVLNLRRVFFRQIRVLGSMMGTRQELEELARLLATGTTRPLIDRTYPLADARVAFERLWSGEGFGKQVLVP